MSEQQAKVYVPSLDFIIGLGALGLTLIQQRFPVFFAASGISRVEDISSERPLSRLHSSIVNRAGNFDDDSSADQLAAVLEDAELLVLLSTSNPKEAVRVFNRELGVETTPAVGLQEATVYAVQVALKQKKSAETKEILAYARVDEKLSGEKLPIKRHYMASVPPSGSDVLLRLPINKTRITRPDLWRARFAQLTYPAFCNMERKPYWHRFAERADAEVLADSDDYFKVYLHPSSTEDHTTLVVEYGGWKDAEILGQEITMKMSCPRNRDIIVADLDRRKLYVQAAEEWTCQLYAVMMAKILCDRGLCVYPFSHLLERALAPDEELASCEWWQVSFKRGSDDPLTRLDVLRSGPDVLFARNVEVRPDGLPICVDRERLRAERDDAYFWRNIGELLRKGEISLNRLHGEYSHRVAHFMEPMLEEIPFGEECELHYEDCWYDPKGNRWSIAEVGDEFLPYIKVDGEPAMTLAESRKDELVSRRINTDLVAAILVEALAPELGIKKLSKRAGSGMYMMGYENGRLFYLFFQGIKEAGVQPGSVNEVISHHSCRPGELILIALEDVDNPEIEIHARKFGVQLAPIARYLSYEEDTGLRIKEEITNGLLSPVVTSGGMTHWPESVEGTLTFRQIHIRIAGTAIEFDVAGKTRRFNIGDLPIFRTGTAKETAAPNLRAFVKFHKKLEEAGERGLRQYGVSRSELDEQLVRRMEKLDAAFRSFFSIVKESVFRRVDRSLWKNAKDEKGTPLFSQRSREQRIDWAFGSVYVNVDPSANRTRKTKSDKRADSWGGRVTNAREQIRKDYNGR